MVKKDCEKEEPSRGQENEAAPAWTGRPTAGGLAFRLLNPYQGI